MVWLMVWFMVWFMIWFMVWFVVWFMVHSNILISKVFFYGLGTGDDSGLLTFFDTLCSSSHWPPGMTWDILLTLRSTWGFYLNHEHQSLSLRLIECARHNVLLEHGELPCVLPYAAPVPLELIWLDLTGLGLGLGVLGFGTGLDNILRSKIAVNLK